MNTDKYNVYEKLNAAVASMDDTLDEAIRNGNNSKELSKKKNRTVLALIIGLIAIICIIAAVIITQIIIPNAEYNKAQQALNDGNYEEAMDMYSSFGDYKDSKSKYIEAEIAAIGSSNIGDIVRYGHYEQDHNEDNGSEPIEWIVIDENDNDEILLLSKDILGYRDMGTINTKDWSDSDIRRIFNNDSDFYISINDLFSAEEQDIIVEKEIKTNTYYQYDDFNIGDDPEIEWHGSEPIGNVTTKDKLFLLSCEEVEKYGKINKDWMIAELSLSAFYETGYTEEDGVSAPYAEWCWTRTSVKDEYKTHDGDKEVSYEFVEVTSNGVIAAWASGPTNASGIRPAMWVKRGSQ